MSVHHAGYAGDGIEHYEARRWFSQGTLVTEIVGCLEELRSELYAHRQGMEAEPTGRATVRAHQHGGGVVVIVRGSWIDQEARDAERSR